MCARRVTLFMAGALLAATSLLAGSQPLTVSPGEPSKLVRIADPCPTFSWGQVDGARGYQLVVYRLDEEGEKVQQVLWQQISGPASGWTPSLDRCLEQGGRYAWSVRAVSGRGTPKWSVPRLFQVAAGPSQVEFEQALAVVRQYLETRDSPVAATATETLATDAGAAEPEAAARRDSPSSPVPPATVSLVTEGAAGIGTSTPQENLHVHSSNDRVGLLVTPTGPLNGFGGDSEILLAEDPYGSFGMKLRYDGGANELQIVGYDSMGETAPPFLAINKIGGTLTVSDFGCDGCVDSGDMDNNSVTSIKIDNGAVGFSDLDLSYVDVPDGSDYSVDSGQCETETACCSLLAGGKKVLSGGPFDVSPASDAILVASAKGTRPNTNYPYHSCWTVTMCSKGGAGGFDFRIRLLCIH